MKVRLLSVLMAGGLLLAACGGTGDANAALTAAAQTLDAQLAAAEAELALQTAEAQQATLEAELAAAEATNEALRLGSTETAAAEATFAAVEPQVIAPNGALCRFGPNTGFIQVAELTAGQAVPAIGISPDGEWWQVASPDGAGSPCWVFWTNDLEFLGDVINLPTIEGPSLPTNTAGPTKPPGYSLNFVHELDCSGTEYAILAVTNNGPDTYESASINLVDVATSTQLTHTDGNNEFLPTDSTCPKGDSTIAPGQTKYLAVPIGGVPSGTAVRASVRLCSENGFRGNCLNNNQQFTVS